MSFTARFDGPCVAGDRIVAGDEIERTDQPGEFIHVDCEEDAEAKNFPSTKRPVCPDCWTTVAVNGSCGCDE